MSILSVLDLVRNINLLFNEINKICKKCREFKISMDLVKISANESQNNMCVLFTFYKVYFTCKSNWCTNLNLARELLLLFPFSVIKLRKVLTKLSVVKKLTTSLM